MRRETFIVWLAICVLIVACAKSQPRTQAVSSPQQTQAETTIRPDNDTPTPSPPTPTPPDATAATEADRCVETLQLPWQVPPISLQARDGRTVLVHEAPLTQKSWRSAVETEFGQPFADGDRIVWMEHPDVVHPTYMIKVFDCATGQTVELGQRDYDHGQVDVPVIDGLDAVWCDWASRGLENGAWWIRRHNLGTGKTDVILDHTDYLPDKGAVGKRPLVPVPYLDDGRFITWIKTKEPDVMNVLAGNLDSREAHLITDSDSGEVSSQVAVDGDRAVFLERDLAKGQWTWDVWLYRFDTDEKIRLTDAVVDERTYELPAIWGDYVAYVETIPTGNGIYTLWLQRLSDNQKWALAMPALGSGGNINIVKLSDGWLVWTSLLAVNFVRVDDPSTVYRFRSSEHGFRQMEVHGGNVVWISNDGEESTLNWFRLSSRDTANR